MRYLLTIALLLSTFISTSAQEKITVALDGSADFTTVQAAVNAVPVDNKKVVEIFIRKGIYKEVVHIDSGKNFIHFKGEGKDKTIISFNNHTGTITPRGDTINTMSSATVFIYGDDFRAEGIGFDNNAGFTAGQAVAVRVHGTRAAFFNCAFTGFQDVLFLSGNGTQNYFEHCYIEGTTDFIFGAATAVFFNCDIHSKKNSHVTAASTAADNPYGFVFFSCRLTADTSVHKVSLGRPWRPASSVTYINCYLGDHIIPAGWDNWKNPANESTVRYAEYGSTGPGANAEARVKWSKQLNKEELAKYRLSLILSGWNPLARQKD